MLCILRPRSTTKSARLARSAKVDKGMRSIRHSELFVLFRVIAISFSGCQKRTEIVM
jgi:hypothetical protein